MAEEDEIKATVYETHGVFMALCNDYPGLTGEGSSREECIDDLTRQIQEKVKEEQSKSTQDEILKRIGPMRRP